jgi:hypothetical protein
VHFVTKVSFYFWNIHKILRLLIPMKFILWRRKKNFGPLFSAWPCHWIKIFLVRYVTNLKRTFVENVTKKSKINPPYRTVRCVKYSTGSEEVTAVPVLQVWSRNWSQRWRIGNYFRKYNNCFLLAKTTRAKMSSTDISVELISVCIVRLLILRHHPWYLANYFYSTVPGPLDKKMRKKMASFV